MNKVLEPLVWAGLQVFKLFSSFVVTIMVMEFIMKNRIDAAQFHILTPLPGTQLYENLDAQGRIIELD